MSEQCPAAIREASIAQFLAAYVRPCACALELRDEGGEWRCAHCDLVFTPRAMSTERGSSE
jgi:hypothetical protein